MDKFEMNLSVKDIVEHEDGSATVILNCDEKASSALIRYALLDILTKAAQETIDGQTPE